MVSHSLDRAAVALERREHEVGRRIRRHAGRKVADASRRPSLRGDAPVASGRMHPIERLRYVARSSGADQALLVRETAGALAGLGFDPPGLVTACRRILDRHLASGPLWWLCARVLTANDPLQRGVPGGRRDRRRPDAAASWPTPCPTTARSACSAGPT